MELVAIILLAVGFFCLVIWGDTKINMQYRKFYFYTKCLAFTIYVLGFLTPLNLWNMTALSYGVLLMPIIISMFKR